MLLWDILTRSFVKIVRLPEDISVEYVIVSSSDRKMVDVARVEIGKEF